MDDEAEWEIMPHKAIENIKNEIDDLKLKAASKNAVSNESLRKSMDNLTHSVNALMALFKEAAEELKIEEESRENMTDQFGPLLDRIDNLESENKKIAQGILAVADLIEKDMKRRPTMISPKKKEIVKRTYSEELVPRSKLPQFEVPKEHQATPEAPQKSFSTVQQNVQTGNLSRHRMDAFASPEPRAPQSSLPPLDRPMPSFGQNEPMMPSGPRMPPSQSPNFQSYNSPGIPQAPNMPPPPRMPPPPMPGMPPMGMPGIPPPPEKKDSGFLGKIFKK